MPIYFRNTPADEPFIFDSVGNCWKQEDTNRPKGYPKYHYLQTEQGCGIIHVQGKDYYLNPDEGLLLAPFIRHSYHSITQDWHTSFITFTGTIENSISTLMENRPMIFIEKELGAQIRPLISRIIKNHETYPADTKAISLDCYHILLLFSNGTHTIDLLNEPLYKRYVEPVLKEIEINYSKTLTVQTLSNQVYITPQYLSRLFQRFLGCSAYEYIIHYRINKAKELLMLHQRMDVQEIATRTGFLDTSHFIAMFHKMAGVTPLEFRKTN